MHTPRDGVFWIAVTDRNAVTRRGIRIGDTQEDARRAYPKLQCGHRDATGERPATDYCRQHLPNGLWLWFGQDPIQSIAITRTTPVPT
jgi:hypothetical protein